MKDKRNHDYVLLSRLGKERGILINQLMDADEEIDKLTEKITGCPSLMRVKISWVTNPKAINNGDR